MNIKLQLLSIIIIIALFSGCSYNQVQMTSYQAQLIENEKNIRKLSYINKYNDYFIRKKIPLVISGRVVKYDPYQKQWLFLINDEEETDQVMVDLSGIPTANRPEFKQNLFIKIYGPLIKDDSLMINYHLKAEAYISQKIAK